MQAALDMAFPLALGMFEPSKFEQELIDEGVFTGENELQRLWMESITTTLAKATLTIPTNCNPSYGGRYGSHTEHLQPLLDEMSEVFASDPVAEW